MRALSWRVLAVLARIAHPVAARLAVARRTCRAAARLGPLSARPERADLEHRVQVVRPVRVAGGGGIAHLRSGREPGLRADIVEVHEERLVLPPVRHGDVAPGAAHAADLVSVEGMQVTAVGVEEAGAVFRPGGVARVVVALEAGAGRLLAGAGGAGPGALEDEVVVGAVRTPWPAVLAAIRDSGGRRGHVAAVAVAAIHGLRADRVRPRQAET